MAKSLVVDSDGHILQPADMWETLPEAKVQGPGHKDPGGQQGFARRD